MRQRTVHSAHSQIASKGFIVSKQGPTAVMLRAGPKGAQSPASHDEPALERKGVRASARARTDKSLPSISVACRRVLPRITLHQCRVLLVASMRRGGACANLLAHRNYSVAALHGVAQEAAERLQSDLCVQSC